MAKFELRLPKLGESIIEATVTAWLKEVGDTVNADESILEVATDKVDTEIPTEVSGILIEKKYQVNDVAKIGSVLAIIETDEIRETFETPAEAVIQEEQVIVQEIQSEPETTISEHFDEVANQNELTESELYLSPLVKSIAQKEGISHDELLKIKGTGLHQRITKDDVLNYLQNRNTTDSVSITSTHAKTSESQIVTNENKPQTSLTDEIIPMDRMGKLIAEHMVRSKQTSAHVQSFIEIDVTKIVKWREANKKSFSEKTGENLTYTPVFMRAVAQTIHEYPLVNVSVDGTSIIKKKNINLGMATALPDGNLIVPVIKNADELSLLGMVKTVNRLAEQARNNKLSPDDIQGGTYTVTNVGSFGSITGTPIINQPQVAILALGAIRKMPSVIETPDGDVIAIRHKMIVAHSYDHRVINGALGGKFILRLKEILENFEETDFL